MHFTSANKNSYFQVRHLPHCERTEIERFIVQNVSVCQKLWAFYHISLSQYCNQSYYFQTLPSALHMTFSSENRKVFCKATVETNN